MARTLASRGCALDAACLLTEACVELAGVDAAGVLVTAGPARPRVIAATDSGLFDAFHAVQADLDLRTTTEEPGEPATVYAAPATRIGQWPRLARFAAAHGIRALCTVPMRAFGVPVGTLVLVCRRAPVLTAAELDAAHGWAVIAAAGMLADAAADALPNTASPLTQYGAFHDQITVWQAAGALAARRGVDIPTASAALRRHAVDDSQPLARSAREVLAWTPEARDAFSGDDRDARVAVVEADPFVSKCLAGMLREEGFEVITAATVHDARGQRANPPPVAVIDQLLPGAVEFGRDLAAGGTRVITMSAVPAGQPPPGAAVLLHRPIPPARVVAAVRRLHPAAREQVPA
ncbi:GAF domain-containing protein [Kutzneria buriramensis]|uniref:GAF domain-containing protein n=1 Tax=Kutzneria buriramensis TaxID=1045776 RepID=UPI0035E720CC